MGSLEAGTRWPYVIAAYSVTLLIMALLVLVSVIAARRARRDLERLERMPGLRRRAPGDDA